MNEIGLNLLVVPPGFEPGSPGPKPEMMDHYTTGLSAVRVTSGS